MSDTHHPKFAKLIEFLARVPAVEINDTPSRGIGTGEDGGTWWIKFSIDIEHDLAWNTVQEFGAVLNYLSVEERLASTFKPVSPPPYLNGGPDEYLSWVVEAPEDLRPGTLADILEDRLPKPVEDEAAWLAEPDEDDEDEDRPTGWLEGEDEDDDED